VSYNNGGTTYGGDQSFVTTAQAPTAQTQAATLITASSATLNSYVDPAGASTTIYYQYGLTTSYGSTTITGNIGTSAGNYGTSISSLSPGTIYHFRIVAYNSGGTTYGGDMSFTTTSSAPTAQTLAATLVTTTSASLNGSINPNGADTTAYFQYGLTTSYGSTTTSGDFGLSSQSVGYVVSGLTPNTLYHFRIVVTSTGGTGYGGDLTFTTTGQPPTAQTQTATLVAATSAHLNASINPNGSDTTAYFQYGLTTTYGNTTTSGDFGTSSQTVGYTVTGLSPNTTYHFRIVASNGAGTSYGSDLTFITPTSPTAGPIVQTLPATSVATTTAQLNGSLNPNGNSTTAHFEYGTTTAYGTSTTSGNFGTTAQTIGFSVSGLLPNTLYHYRLDAVNSAGSVNGNDETFTTSPLTASSQTAYVSGTGGIGLRLRSAASLSATVLAVMPDGSQVTLIGDTQTADGLLWRDVQYGSLSGWAASEYLVFGTLPAAPSAPTGLQQFQADGVTSISAGGSASGNSVVLSATTGGSSSLQYIVQFEVRPLGTAFFAPTLQSAQVLGGAQARVSVGGLLNQSYHWQARTVDGNGQTSPWAQFGNGSTADFSIGAASTVSALFSYSPAVPVTGSQVQFTAQAAGGSGWTFQWNFGGGVTPTGSSVGETFASAGPVSVTLTVTDPQGHQATDTETVQVVDGVLVNAINRLAQNSSTLLDQITTQAQQAANAADDFQQGIDSAPGTIAISGAFTILSLGSDASEYQDWLKSTTGQDAAGGVITVIEQTGANWLQDALYVQHQSCSSLFIPNIQSFIAQKKSAIELQRQAAITAAASLTAAQAAQLAINLNARYAGNLAVSDDYLDKEMLPVTFDNLKTADESDWTLLAGEDLFDASVGIGLVAAAPGLGVTGAVADMLSVSSSFGLGELDILDTLSQQSSDVQMFSLSLDVLGQATISARVMSDNVMNGLQAVINSQVETAPAGQISVQHIAQGELQQFGFSPGWFTTAAYADVTIQNTGTVTASYRVEALYANDFTTAHLPIHGYGIGERDYDINVLSTANPIQLTPGQQQVARINYKTSSGGQVPSGEITYTLTATTSDGNYLEGTAFGQFGTTLIDTNGTSVDHSTEPQVILENMPMASTLLQFGSSTTCILAINVQNSLGDPLLLDLQQPFPAGTTVIDADGGTVSANQILWELNLQPGDVKSFQVALILPSPLAAPPLSNTVAMAYDEVQTNWVQFQATPSLIQVAQPPQALLQPLGLTGQGFNLSLQTYVPGVYRIDATTDFITWTPVSTTTNLQGTFTVQDVNAKSKTSQFYRAVQIK
jgi:hypothetical protein